MRFLIYTAIIRAKQNPSISFYTYFNPTMQKPTKARLGRPPMGKRKYTLTLTEKTVTKVRKTQPNLSGFLDERMESYLKEREEGKS